MRTSINKKSDFDFIVLDNEGNAIDMPTSDFTLDLWTWGSKCRFRASSIGGVLKGCKSDNGKLRVYVDNPGFVPGKLVGEWVSYISSEEYPDGTQRTCRYISDFGIDMVDGDSQTNEVQVLAMMQYIQGESAYEIACDYGFDGTEQEWLDSLALPANEAAAECRTLITELSNAEAQRVANEDVRTTNEGTRAQQESARVTAEQQRIQAESDRALAETNRNLNETFRNKNEQQRNDNEAARVKAEKNRVANESSRVSDEALRVQAETERVEAEAGRETAESNRMTAENNRALAEVDRVGAEQRRKYSESGRQDNEAKRKDAEEYRIRHEVAREATESSRVKAENERVSAENLRKTAEEARVANEATRQTNEQARVAAETSRESAEANRANAEAARADAEQARAEEFAGFSTTLAAKEDAANKVTSINAGADDVHYPSAKAVKDSLANVKNIEVTPDMLSESTKQFINASGGGTITNFADDEDLTTVDNALKLADKTYDPITYSGMGRKYLRKNIVGGKNILTQEMLPSANTIYIIQYDYDLNGAAITIPENCTLDFQGGSLANGVINGSNTEITAHFKCIFNDVQLSGTYANKKWLVEWFGASLDKEDNHTYINYAIEMLSNLKVPSSLQITNSYKIKDTIWLRPWVSLNGVAPYSGTQTANSIDKHAGSGFIANFDDSHKWIIDTFVIKSSGEIYNVPYNQMYINLSTSVSWDTIRKCAFSITNIGLQVSNNSEQCPIFGGIRLIDLFESHIDSVYISEVAIGMAFHNSWAKRITNCFFACCLCGIYFGKYNTGANVCNCDFQANQWGKNHTWTEEVLWRDGEKLYPEYDENGTPPNNENFISKISINSAGVMSESHETDSNIIFLQSCSFQNLDAAILNGINPGSVKCIDCYSENVKKVLIWSYEGACRWDKPSYPGGMIFPYYFATIFGFIGTDSRTFYPTCYPYVKYSKNSDDVVSYHNNNKYDIKYAYLYDKYDIDETNKYKVINTVSAPKLYPVVDEYYVGFWQLPIYDRTYLSGLSTGIKGGGVPAPMKNVINAFNPSKATFWLKSGATDYSCDGMLFENKDWTFERYDNNQSSTFYIKQPFRIKNSNLLIKLGFKKSFDIRLDEELTAEHRELDYVFECYGKCKIVAPVYNELRSIFCLAGTEPIDLEIIMKGYWGEPNELIYNINYGTKYRIKITTAMKTVVYTNPTRPTAGLSIGDMYVENAKPIWWTGSAWVDATGAEV